MWIRNGQLIFLVVIVLDIATAARILGVFPYPCKSHGILGNILLKELATRGHEVTMISSYPLEENVTNYRHIFIRPEEGKRLEAYLINNPFLKAYSILNYVYQVSDALLSDANVKRLVDGEEKFDLVINWGAESVLGLSHALNATAIRFSVIGMYSFPAAYSMNPTTFAYVPHFLLPYSEDMNIFERMMNTLMNLFCDIYIEYVLIPNENDLVQKHFPGAPHLTELQQNVRLNLVNSHMAIENVRPYLANVIHIGGYQMQAVEELPDDLKTYLDEATNGVILFSVGTSMNSSFFGDKLRVILQCFATLPYQILWKNNENVVGQPSNVKTVNWFPQKAVLNHSNVKLFICHGGYGSVTESIYYGVPMIILPFVLDQFTNGAQSSLNGIAIALDVHTLTEDKLRWAINEITTNPTYLTEIAVRSDAFRHQDTNPMEKAMYWIERMLKQTKPNYLKCKASEMPLYKYYLLDVFALICLFTFITACIFAIPFKLLLGI